MIVKGACFFLLFLASSLCVGRVNGVLVEFPPENITGDLTTSATHKTFTSTTNSPLHEVTESKVYVSSEATKHNSPKSFHTTTVKTEINNSVHINHLRTSTLAPTTQKPPTSPLTTEVSVATSTEPLPKGNVDHTGKNHTKEDTKKHTHPPSTTSKPSERISMPIESKTGSSIEAAGVVALVCIIIAVFAFTSLIAWRHFYRKRHGNREILINEEDVDFNDEDLRHFEATTCIQLEPEA